MLPVLHVSRMVCQECDNLQPWTLHAAGSVSARGQCEHPQLLLARTWKTSSERAAASSVTRT